MSGVSMDQILVMVGETLSNFCEQNKYTII